MAKTLVIAEKPSVGADYARALGGNFDKREGFLESDKYVVSWAVGHLVGLAEPEDYDEGLKRWSIKSLPILPDSFQLQPDPKGRKQLGVLDKLIKRSDIDDIVNGCDAGREGELIFAYIYEWTKAKKPVRRLWVSSMTRDAIKQGFDYVVLLHGDGQYAPEYLPQIVAALGSERPDALIASRMIKSMDALRGHMPLYKWTGNQVLTAFENRVLGSDLSEFHSGYRAYKVEALASIPRRRKLRRA